MRLVGTQPLGMNVDDLGRIVSQIRMGLSYGRLTRFQKTTGLSMASIARFIGVSQRTLTRRAREGKLRPSESDRLLRVSQIFEMAADLFEGNVAAARRWLETPQLGLAGQMPLDFASTYIGAQEVENLTGRLEDGIVA